MEMDGSPSFKGEPSKGPLKSSPKQGEGSVRLPAWKRVAAPVNSVAEEVRAAVAKQPHTLGRSSAQCEERTGPGRTYVPGVRDPGRAAGMAHAPCRS